MHLEESCYGNVTSIGLGYGEAPRGARAGTKTWFIRQAIEEYLDEWEDYHIALSRLEQEKDEVDISDVRRRLGLEG